MHHPIARVLASAAAGLLLAACGGGGGGGTIPFGGGSPNGTHMYVANSEPQAQPWPGPLVSVFTSPFSASTTSSGSITSGVGSAVGVAIDPTDSTGKVYVSTFYGGSVAVYARPNPSGGAPLFTVSGGGMVQPNLMNFDATGNLFVGDKAAGKVFEIAKPISAASVPTPLSLTAPGTPTCAAIDAAGNLYEVDYSTSPTTLRMYGPSHSGAQIASTTVGMAADSDVCAVDPVTQRIYVDNYGGTSVGYATPLTNGAAPVVTLTFPAGSGACGLGFDAAGTLYINVTVPGSSSVIDAFMQPIVTGAPGPVAFAFTNNGNHSSALQIATGP